MLRPEKGVGVWRKVLLRIFTLKEAVLLTGNHDYTIYNMPYRNAPIRIEDGAWIGAKAVVCPEVTAHENSILTVGSIATKEMEKDGIYQGNPAQKIRERKIIISKEK